MPKLEFDVSVKEGGLKELKKQIREMEQLTSRLVAQFGAESEQAKKAGAQLEKLKNQKSQLTSEVKKLSGGIKVSTMQLLEMGENITVVLAGIKSITGGIYNFGKSAITSAADFEELRSHFIGAESDIYNFQKATSFTVSKSDLIKLSNQASDLGISLEKQPMFFLLAKTAAEKYGTDVTTAFQSVIMATEGNIKGLKQIGVQKEVYKKIVSDLTKSMGGEIETIQGVNGEQEIQIKNLDPLVQKNIRLEAILKATGVTMEDVNRKTQSNADKLAQLDLLVPQVKKQFGELLAGGIIPLTDGLRNAEGKFNTASVAVAGLTISMGQLLPAMASVKIMSSALFASISMWTGALVGLVAQIGLAVNAWNQLKLAFTGNWRQTIGGKYLYGADQTDSEMNSKNEVGIFEGIKNRFRQLKDFRAKLSELNKNKKETEMPTTSQVGRGGKSPILKEAEEVEILAKAMKDLKAAYEQTTDKAQMFLEPMGLNAYSKLRPADQFTGARSAASPDVIQTLMETMIVPISESFQNAFSNITSTISSLSVFFGEAGQNFISDLIEGFNRIAGIVQFIAGVFDTIKAVQGFIGVVTSILGFSPAGMAGMISPRVQTTSNVYISANMDGLTFMKSNMPLYNNYQNYRRL